MPTIPKFSSLNPFATKEVPLAGKRVAILEESSKLQADLAPANQPVTLPPQQANTDWTQPGGNATNAPGHLALGAGLKRAWSADAGDGTSSRGRLTASPITYNGRVYTLDISSRVSAYSMSGGAAAWRVKLAPENEHGYEGFGGGIAADGGRLYVATGFGSVYALDPNTGKQIWQKKIGEPVRASVTAVADRVYVPTTGGRLVALSGVDGNELWQYRGLPEETSISSNPSPAVSGDVVVVPYASGELVALNASSGQPLWVEALSRTRTSSAMGTLNNVARPAIADGIVYAVGNSGRIIAVRLQSGERLWSADVSGNQMPWVAGNNLFVVDTGGQLLALDRQSGQVLWTTKLKGSNTWSGPVLAGGALWVVSSTGDLVSVDASVGKTIGSTKIGSAAYIAPIVAQGRVFVLADNANLVALN
jgi:outer membrane protein assembly factor BamB